MDAISCVLTAAGPTIAVCIDIVDRVAALRQVQVVLQSQANLSENDLETTRRLLVHQSSADAYLAC